MLLLFLAIPWLLRQLLLPQLATLKIFRRLYLGSWTVNCTSEITLPFAFILNIPAWRLIARVAVYEAVRASNL
jgi:hypothetical protein